MFMSSSVKSYFEIHAHDYPKDPEFYSSIINQIKNITPKNSNAKFLDLGCGNGNFIKALIDAGIKADYFATDLSLKMIHIAKENLCTSNVELFVADGFEIPIKPNIKFDVIHIDSVLHHLIAKTRGKSTNLVKKILELLVDKLADNDILIIEEICYGSYIIPKFTSFIIFYGLKLINFLKLDLTRFMSEMKPALEVNFLHEKQLLKILSQYGSPYLAHKQAAKIRKVYKLFLLKNLEHVTFLLKMVRLMNT